MAYEPGVDETNIHESSLAANFNREGHTKMDTARALRREIEAGESVDDLAEVVGKGVSWVRQYLSLNDLVPELQEMLDSTDKSRRLAVALGALLAGYPQEKQLTLYRKHVAGQGHEAARHSVRVSEGAARNHTSDSKWGLRRIAGAAAAVAELKTLREKIVKQMTKEEAEAGLVMLDEIRTGVISLAVDLRLVALR